MSELSEVRTDGNSLLKAVHLSRLRLTRLLLEGGAYINESNDRGETPLMVACKTRHADAQSVPKHKMVRYLLESGADPNIQDKSGRTALMHACLHQAGAPVLSLLLSSGADPSLEDHAGSSALVYAVNSGDKEVLRVLLDACRAKGKEVIIITTDRLPSGTHMTKQYLNVPPPPDLEERLRYPAAPCCTLTSPSEIQLHAPPLEPQAKPNASPTHFGSPLVGLRDPKGSAGGGPPPPCLAAGSQPSSPTRGDPRPSPPGPGGANKLLNLHRLHSEPRLKIPPSLQNQSQGSSLTEQLKDMSPEQDDASLRVSSHGGLHGGSRPPAVSRHHSIDVKDAAGLLKALGRSPESQATGGALSGGVKRGLLGRKMSYDSTATSSLSHPNLHRDDGCPRPQETADNGSLECLPHLAVSSLRNVVQRRNIGMDHYSSDSQLPQFGHQHREDVAAKSTVGTGAGLERRKLANISRSSTLSGSRESLESAAQRRSAAAGLERRGSGALLLDHISHTRPHYLPPLNPHAPIPDIGVSPASSGHLGGSSKALNGVAGSKPIQPCAPSFPRDLNGKNLLRRHSMQTEQIKQLVNFEELFGH